MSRRSVCRKGAALLAAAVAAFASAAAAAADTSPTPASPDDASALIAGSGTSVLSATTVVDPSTALAAASVAGAVTSVESDLTLADAVGLDASTETTVAAPTLSGSSLATFSPLATAKMCWADRASNQWGIWPYEQKLAETTYWCGIYGVKVTYRTSSVTGGGTLCGLSWRAIQLVGGGIGFPSFTLHSSAGYACPTVVPWVTLHPSHYIDVRRDSRGGAAIVATG